MNDKTGRTRMTFDRRRLMQAAAAAPLAALLPRMAQAQQGTINYWHHFTSDTEFRGLERVMALFRARYPNIRLTQENIPNPEYMSKVTTAVMANAKPNTAMVTADRVNDMIAMGALVDITDRIRAWEGGRQFPEDRWQGATVRGKIYGIPAFTFVDWVYYRKDWFDEAGLAPPRTYEEFQAAAIRMTDRSRNRYGFGLRGGAGGAGFVIDAIEAYGSPIVVEGRAAIDRAKAVQAVTFWSELLTRHRCVPPSAPNDGYRQLMEAFKIGQTAMVWHHTGSFTEIAAALRPGTQFMTAAKPAGPAQRIARLTYLFNGIMNPANVEAAWAWITFWADPEPAVAFLEATGYFPASPATASDPRIAGNPLYVAAVETTRFGRLPPAFVGSAGWADNVVLPEFQKVLVGNATPAAAVDAMIRGLEQALR
jgi:multiple sugar transport system substrate-binding protein